jgi:hypothetical protein
MTVTRSPHRIPLVRLGAALAGIPVLFGVTLANAGSANTVETAHLRLEVTTSSDWTQVHLSGGQVVTQRLLSKTGAGVYSSQNDGLALSGLTGSSTFTVDIVFADFSRAASYPVKISKAISAAPLSRSQT